MYVCSDLRFCARFYATKSSISDIVNNLRPFATLLLTIKDRYLTKQFKQINKFTHNVDREGVR